MNWLRKLIIKWLFKYPVPEYFHAIKWYENIVWDSDKTNEYNTINRRKVFSSFSISYEKYQHDTVGTWTISDANDADRWCSIRTTQYADFIEAIDSILRYGVIKPKSNER